MKLEEIEKIINNPITEKELKDLKKAVVDGAKEIYKVHLEKLLEQSHYIFDNWSKTDIDGFIEFISDYNISLQQKLKTLEE